MNDEIIRALQDWFGLTDVDEFNRSLETLFVEGGLKSLTKISQGYYGGRSELILFRWESDAIRNDKILESWTTDKKIAESYEDLRPGKLVTKTTSVSNIILCVDALYEAGYELDDILGVAPMGEVIIKTSNPDSEEFDKQIGHL